MLRGYLATPEGEGPFPAVLMIHEAFGLDDITVRHADRLAAAGYLTLAVDLFSDGGARRCLVATMRSLSAGEGRAFTDLATARDWLLDTGRTTGKIGVIGFCMGGGFALLLANDGFDAAAVNYGRPRKTPGRPSPAPAPSWPISVARTALCREPRPSSPPCSTAWAWSTTSRSSRPPGTRFLNDAEVGPKALRPLFRVMGIKPDPESAPEAWRRIEDHFAKRLKRPST